MGRGRMVGNRPELSLLATVLHPAAIPTVPLVGFVYSMSNSATIGAVGAPVEVVYRSP